MILSLHPLFQGDRHLNPAGRQPNQTDEILIRQASAVVLPQGCPQSWYALVRHYQQHVFPNYDARWRFPGKIGQIEMFQRYGWCHPRTLVFRNSGAYLAACAHEHIEKRLPLPLVFKYDWGGEGETVFLMENPTQLSAQLEQAQRYEKSGQAGFLLQELVPDQHRVLRVVVIGSYRLAYWRVAQQSGSFLHNVASGALCDFDADIELQQKALKVTEDICHRTRINLAGLDFLFGHLEPEVTEPQPLLLEINYYFGRKGLGGSERYYRILQFEINQWLHALNLTP
jgi:ribosomal protein S6--L-glutamate ligase